MKNLSKPITYFKIWTLCLKWPRFPKLLTNNFKSELGPEYTLTPSYLGRLSADSQPSAVSDDPSNKSKRNSTIPHLRVQKIKMPRVPAQQWILCLCLLLRARGGTRIQEKGRSICPRMGSSHWLKLCSQVRPDAGRAWLVEPGLG